MDKSILYIYNIYIYYISWVLAVSGRGNDSDSELATHPLQFFLASRVANGLWMPQKVAEADQVHGTFSHDSQVWFDFLYIYREREYQYITYYMWFLSRTFNYCWPPSGHPSTLVLRTCAMLFLAIPSLRQHLWALRKAESIGTHWLARSRKNCQWSAQFAWIWKLLDAACIFLTWPVLAVNIWTILECFLLLLLYITYILFRQINADNVMKNYYIIFTKYSLKYTISLVGVHTYTWIHVDSMNDSM